MLCQLPKSLSRGCLDLKSLDFLDSIAFIHSLYDRVHVTDQFLFQHFGLVGQNMLRAYRARKWVMNGVKRQHLKVGS